LINPSEIRVNQYKSHHDVFEEYWVEIQISTKTAIAAYGQIKRYFGFN